MNYNENEVEKPENLFTYHLGYLMTRIVSQKLVY